MADETTTLTIDSTQTTTGTGTTPADGSATGTSQNEGGLAAALGDGTGKAPDSTGIKEPSGDASKTPDKPPTGAPEKYTPWTVPEGYELDAGLVEEASPIFKELGLTQEQSQKLVDFYSKHALGTSNEAIKAWNDQCAEWREGMLSDPVLGKLVGKDGKHGADSPLVQTINRALDGLQNPTLVHDFKAAMELTGAGDNPAFVKVFHALASKVTEGTSYAQGQPVAAAKGRPASPGAALYPNLPSTHGG